MKPLRVVPGTARCSSRFGRRWRVGPALFVAVPGSDPAGLPDEVEQRIALVVETSGSSGRPKRVALSADAILSSAAASESALGGPGQWVSALPLHYIAGINVLTRSLAAETNPVDVEGEPFHRPRIRRGRAAARHPGTVHRPRACAARDPDGRCRGTRRVAGVSRGAGRWASDAGATAQRARHCRASGWCAATDPARPAADASTTGCPSAPTEVRIVDGEVWLAGPSLAERYLGDAELTAERFRTADGLTWFRTGDAGTWDGERLTVTGRLDDVIVSGGVKVSLGAVERMLREQPGFERRRRGRWGRPAMGSGARRLHGSDRRRDRGNRRHRLRGSVRQPDPLEWSGSTRCRCSRAARSIAERSRRGRAAAPIRLCAWRSSSVSIPAPSNAPERRRRRVAAVDPAVDPAEQVPPATLSTWIAGARPLTLLLAVAPVALGTATASLLTENWYDHWVRALLALVVALGLQIGVNYANDYSDGVRGVDKHRVGPVRLVGSGRVRPRLVLMAALVFFAIAAAAGSRPHHPVAGTGGSSPAACSFSLRPGSIPVGRSRTGIGRSARLP